MNYTILCVDDEMSNLEALDRLLRKDYKILTATSGPDALQILARETVQLLVSDQRMPDMTGVEFLTKSIAICPDAVRILLTGFADLDSVIHAINQGQIYRYVTKPWDPAELKTTIKQALDVFQMRQTITLQNKALVTANQELRSLDQLKTDFMLLVNHELRTPLTAMTSYLQLLLEEDLNDEQELYVEKIKKNVDRLENLIRDTLLITRLKSTHKKIELQTVDLKYLLDSLWEDLGNYYGNKDLKLAYHGPVPFKQLVNEEFAKIILQKVIRNSYQHSLPNSKVRFEFAQGRDTWRLLTSNQLAKKIERSPAQLLNAFSKDEDILNHTGGAGLGLAVINSVVQMFGGTVDLSYDQEKFELQLNFPKTLG